MNEFIVWDKKNKIFCSGMDILNDNDGQFESFDYVMMDDNGTKIYENSTIFEFDFYEYESTKTTKRYFFNLLSTKKVEYKYVNKGGAVAIFEWDNKKLCYNIRFVNGVLFEYHLFFYSKYQIKNIKVVDTIQENHLGLIL